MALISCGRCYGALRVSNRDLAQMVVISSTNGATQARKWGKQEGICEKNTSGHWMWCENCLREAFPRHGFSLKRNTNIQKSKYLPSTALQQPNIEYVDVTVQKPAEKPRVIERIVEKSVYRTVEKIVEKPVEKIVEKVVEKKTGQVIHRTSRRTLALVGGLFFGLGYLLSDGPLRTHLESAPEPPGRSDSGALLR